MARSSFLFRSLSLGWAVLACPLPLLLLFVGITPNGRLFAIAALLLGVTPLLACLTPARSWGRHAAVGAFVGWLLLTVWLFTHSPDGKPTEQARVRNRYSNGQWHYQRLALGALLPEIDQFLLGFPLIPAVDSLFTRQQAQEVSRLTTAIYGELEADPDFHALGSVMPDAYGELWRSASTSDHYFLYVPPHLDRKTPAPVLVFLHGAGGNFKAYTWLLSRIADERGLVLIAPSGGIGNWEDQRAPRAVAAALADAGKLLALDRSQVHLAGLSNGGLAVSRTAASEIEIPFRSLIFLSPVFDEIALLSAHFTKRSRNRPILVITGQTDNRVPLDYVTGWAAVLRNAGAHVAFSTYPDADHFLVFSHRERFVQELSEWLALHAGSASR